MTLRWYSALKYPRVQSPSPLVIRASGFAPVAGIRAGHAVDIHGEVKDLAGRQIGSRHGRTAGVVVDTPVTSIMPRRDSSLRGSNRGTLRLTLSEPLHR